MILLEETKSLLRSHRTSPKKEFGQNFLVEPSVYQLMIDYASLNQDDTVLDIGAGFGFLTRLMAGKCRTVVAVESDGTLANVLRERLSGLSNVKLVEGDVLKADIPEFSKIVSTPPYNISSDLLLWIFSRSFNRAVLIFQREFADRLVARVASEKYGWLAVLTHYWAEVELLDKVSKSSFYPQPEIDSVIVRVVPKERRLIGQEEMLTFKRFVKVLFTHRNKKVKGAVLAYLRGVGGMSKLDAAKVAEKLPYSDSRVRELAPEDFGVFINAIRR
jgi:16S rRNA (adenine1518-N6/adenine1519-N6)-dimethyltransferase